MPQLTAVLPAPDTDAFTRALSSGPIPAPVSPTILIADDDDDVRDVIEFKLQVAGYRTLTADNGRSALNLAMDRRPRAIILDVTMPQLDGLSVCHALHARPETAEIPVLMISANSRQVDVDLGTATPFVHTEMLRRVTSLLRAGGR